MFLCCVVCVCGWVCVEMGVVDGVSLSDIVD